MKKILVVGGAGYIGSYMCKQLSKRGIEPVVLDDLSRGYRAAVKWGSFVEGNMADGEVLHRIFKNHHIDAVMHFAGYINVAESVQNPSLYYRNNVGATLPLLQAMMDNGITKFIFSSSAAVYGNPIKVPIPESHGCIPVNPYGRSKQMVEEVLEDVSRAHDLNYISLRYFNAAGADPEGDVGEAHSPETHLIPLAVKAAMEGKAISIFGTDYSTEDGTCVRDYVHIHDLVQAHILALDRLDAEHTSGIYNLGNGNGYSVREVVDMVKHVTGNPLVEKYVHRRPGDPAVLVASSERANRELGWQPRYPKLEDIVDSAWQWHRRNPEGYVTAEGKKSRG